MRAISAALLLIFMPTVVDAVPRWQPPPPDDPTADLYPDVPSFDFWQRSELVAQFGYRKAFHPELLGNVTADFNLRVDYRFTPFEFLGFFFGPTLEARLLTTFNNPDLDDIPGSQSYVFGAGIHLGWKIWLTDWLSVSPTIYAQGAGLSFYARHLDVFTSWFTLIMGIDVPFQFQLGFRHGIVITPFAGFTRSDDPYMWTVGIQAGYALQFGAEPPPPPKPVDDSLEIEIRNLENLFPALYPARDGIPVSLRITNVGPDPLQRLRISVSLEGFVDRPTVYALDRPLESGEEVDADVLVLANGAYQFLEDSRRSKWLLDAEYNRRGFDFEARIDNEILVHSRNTITWQDDRIIAVFVNPRDTLVNSFATRAVATYRELEKPSIPRNVDIAIKLFTVMEALSFSYVTDPTAPFMNSFGGGAALDTVSYPREMLIQRAGDCDDLTSTYAALLESVGISTAFVTIPGHIFMLVDTGVSESEWQRVTSLRDWLVFQGGKVWLPVEVTAVGQGFMRAWERGRDNFTSTMERLRKVYPTSQAWSSYDPVLLTDESESMELPVQSLVERLFGDAIEAYSRREVALSTQPLVDALNDRPNDVQLILRTGLEYARWMRFTEGRAYFETALTLDPNNLNAKVGLAYMELNNGRASRAQQIYDGLESRHANHAAVIALRESLENESLRAIRDEPDSAGSVAQAD